ncbi:uncharacterized protein C2845_PM07G36920 [Panicum miliaceum]|uniref:Uncharacterized protein n=1 Tax=Panicum miliaceum TaxID=4540 RepID=A0A3L6SRI4_PANMI|nr:uncharacterized protein C2845_PM07G36920 [Panicum miliaceum]
MPPSIHGFRDLRRRGKAATGAGPDAAPVGMARPGRLRAQPRPAPRRHRQLRGRGVPRAAGEVQRQRVRLAVRAVLVALSATFASRVAEAMPLLALKLAVWGVTAVFLGLGFCLLFCSGDA